MKQNFNVTDKVSLTISGKIDGVDCQVETTGWISEIRLKSSDKERYLEYGITADLPDVYHYGEPPKWWRVESLIKKV